MRAGTAKGEESATASNPRIGSGERKRRNFGSRDRKGKNRRGGQVGAEHATKRDVKNKTEGCRKTQGMVKHNTETLLFMDRILKNLQDCYKINIV